MRDHELADIAVLTYEPQQAERVQVRDRVLLLGVNQVDLELHDQLSVRGVGRVVLVKLFQSAGF